MLMRVDLPREVDSATLSYRVKFDANYDWTAGGKLPGLCDGGTMLLLLFRWQACSQVAMGILLLLDSTSCLLGVVSGNS